MRAFAVSTSPRLLGSRGLSSKSGPTKRQTSGDPEKTYLMKGGVPKSIPLVLGAKTACKFGKIANFSVGRLT